MNVFVLVASSAALMSGSPTNTAKGNSGGFTSYLFRLTDWHCGSHRSRQVFTYFGFVPYSGESWRKDCNRRDRYLYDWTSGSAITTHDHSTGNDIEQSYNILNPALTVSVNCA